MNKNFNVAEILQSIDAIVDDDKYKTIDKNIDVLDDKITEKIINDAEKSIKNKNPEKNNDKIRKSLQVSKILTSSNFDLSKPLMLEEEFEEEEEILEDYDLIEQTSQKEKDLAENYSEKINDNKELKNSYIYENNILKSENTKQQEIIKDINILLQDFKKQKRYADLYRKIRLYQEDNTILRKKIFSLLEEETRLRLQLAQLAADNQIDDK